MVRPEGFEPPAYWSVVSGSSWSEECVDDRHDDCWEGEWCGCDCHDAGEDLDARFWAIVANLEAVRA